MLTTRTTPSVRGPAAATTLQTHVSIDTADLARSSAFYRALFDREPVLERPDYVRFWPAELGLVLGLNARPPAPAGGPVRHLGVLFPDAAGLLAARERLAAAGFGQTGAHDVTCCYARLDQFWAADPSGVVWELFLAHEPVLDPAPPEATLAGSACCAPTCCGEESGAAAR